MNTRDLIEAAKNTVITKEMVDVMKIRIDAFDKECELKNQPMNTEQLNRVYSDVN